MEKILLVLSTFIASCCGISASVEVDLLRPNDELKAFIKGLESKDPVKSDFEELRTNPFQKTPRRFEGTIYWHPDYGLSLEYSSPTRSKINVDEKTITLIKPGESPKELQVTADNPALSMFFRLFDWKTDWIAKNFEAEADFSSDSNTLRLKPRDDHVRSKINQLVLQIENGILSSILLDLSAGKEILIRLSGQEIPWDADPSTLNRQFGINNEAG